MKHKNFIIGGIIFLLVVGAVFLLSRFADHAEITYLDQKIDVLVADNPIEQQKGLSGTKLESLDADGMLFIFKEKEERTFWMHNMNYNLDVIWLADKKIVKIDRDVEAPKDGEEPEYMRSNPMEVDMVLELPAGKAAEYDFLIGASIEVKR